jgi:hypothetical protein
MSHQTLGDGDLRSGSRAPACAIDRRYSEPIGAEPHFVLGGSDGSGFAGGAGDDASPRTVASAPPSLAFVCCVESGPLEAETIRMADSLRRFGGAFATCPVYAVRSRIGPRLGNSTMAAFDRLDVTFLDAQFNRGYTWQHYLNKVYALRAVEATTDVETVCWLDRTSWCSASRPS